MKFNDLEKDVPVELTGILGDEELEVDAEPLDLDAVMERATGVSLSPYSQQKMVMSDEAIGHSDRGDIFHDIFGETAQSDFLKSTPAISFDLVPAVCSIELPQ